MLVAPSHLVRGRYPLGVLVMTLVVSLGISPRSAWAQAAPELIISEYIEGSSNNKAIEIYNGTGAAVDLTAGSYNLQMFFNGSASAGLTINLTGTVAADDVFVIAQASANSTILAQADQTNGAGWFNGDDAVVLRKGTTIIDSIGQVGFDPGTEWGTGLVSTADNTLRRRSSVSAGDTNPSDSFDPALEWDGFAVDTFGGLGALGDVAPFVIATAPAPNATSVALDATITVTFSEPVSVIGSWFTVACANSGSHTATVSGGPTSFTLDSSTDFASAESCTVTVLAAQVADEDTADPPDNMAVNHSWTFSAVTVDPCVQTFTPIYSVQGSGRVNTFNGSTVMTRGVVSGDFQGGAKLSGFFLEDPIGDGNILTSDGIFVFVPAANPLSSVDVTVGEVVRVTGRATEFNTLTEIDSVTAIDKCGLASSPVAPAVVDLPELANGDLERYEGMLVTLPETLTVDQTFFQGRFGQVTLSSDGRLFNPTGLFRPDTQQRVDLTDENARRLLVLDDGTSAQNPNPIPYIGQDNTLRAGDTLSNLTGVLDWGSISSDANIRDYRLHPTIAPTFTRNNPRPATPEAVGGTLKVASANVLNYFTTIDQAGAQCFPTLTRNDCRGADSELELERQRNKIVASLQTINADVVGLMEIENDNGVSTKTVKAVQDLAGALNAAMGPGTYDWVREPAPGGDAIKVAMLYKPSRVTPVGAALNYQVSDAVYGPALFDRPPLAQTFFANANGGILSVVVNHFKSKSSCPTSGPDTDQGDGQGCWNAKRVRQAEELRGFIAVLKASAADDDVLIIGDLNSYGKEDPIDTLTTAGLVNQIERFVANPYSFIFDGQSGYLDHALTTQAMGNQVTGVTEWHINADEPSVIDYNTEFKPQDLFAPTPYRSSDHDPVIIGLQLSGITFASLCDLTTLYSDNVGVAKALCSLLQAAQTAVAHGNLQAKAGAVRAYISAVQAQSGKALTETEAGTLIALATRL